MSETGMTESEREDADLALLQSPFLVMPDFDYNVLTRKALEPAMLPGCTRRALTVFALACALHEVINFGMIPPNPAAFQLIIQSNSWLTRRLNKDYQWEPSEKPVYLGLDTVDREYVMATLAKHFTDMDWPSNGDSHSVHQQFRLKLEDALEAAGWRNTFGVM